MNKTNVRVLTKAVALVSLLAPASGHALGIGAIKLHSALNQNLDADISLILSGENLSDIKVNLAPPEKFNEAGVSWNYFLPKIKFESIIQANGSVVVKLTSQEALKEPFLDFLLEVSWPKGNLYREFTVLVDPPLTYNQETTQAAESSAQSSVPQNHDYDSIGGSQYGPTQTSDTLWSIAEHEKGQSDISVEQMIMAIYQANPQAFYKGNIHVLMAGKMLTIPGREAVLKLSRKQALAEFIQQTKTRKSHSTSIYVEKNRQKPVLSKVEDAIDNQLILAAPINETTEGQAVVDKPIQGVIKGTGLAESAVVSVDDAIQNKLLALEKQLAMMQELIALKDQQLVALQNQSLGSSVVQELPVSKEVASAKSLGQTIPIPESVQPASSDIIATKPSVPVLVAPSQTVVPVVQSEPGTVGLYYFGGAAATVMTLLGWLWWRERKVDKKINLDSMFASSSMVKIPEAVENVSVSVGEDIDAAHEVGTIGESSFLSEFTPSDFDSFDTDQGEIDPISEADVYLAYGRYQQAEELIRQAIKDQPNRDENKLKLLEIFYANEDSMAFEAYANELVEAGRRNEVGFWEKVAEMGREICPTSSLFSAASNSFVADLQHNENMGINLSSFSMELDDHEPGVVATDKSSAAMNFDLSSFSMDNKESEEPDHGVIAAVTSTGKKTELQRENTHFDLNSLSIESDHGVIATSARVGRSSGVQVDDIDFDLSSFAINTEEIDETSAELGSVSSGTNQVNKEDEFESYEFSFSSDQTEATGLDDFDFSALENDNKSPSDVDFSADISLDFDDLNGNFDFGFDIPNIANEHDKELGVSDFTDMDALETKLDLAKAYVDMGDAVAGKDLAREVLEQGTTDQKGRAQALLEELG